MYLCLEKISNLNHFYINHEYVKTASRPWNKDISKEIQNSNSNQNTLSEAQQECKEIGFIENTKKFENCVKMMK